MSFVWHCQIEDDHDQSTDASGFWFQWLHFLVATHATILLGMHQKNLNINGFWRTVSSNSRLFVSHILKGVLVSYTSFETSFYRPFKDDSGDQCFSTLFFNCKLTRTTWTINALKWQWLREKKRNEDQLFDLMNRNVENGFDVQNIISHGKRNN